MSHSVYLDLAWPALDLLNFPKHSDSMVWIVNVTWTGAYKCVAGSYMTSNTSVVPLREAAKELDGLHAAVQDAHSQLVTEYKKQSKAWEHIVHLVIVERTSSETVRSL